VTLTTASTSSPEAAPATAPVTAPTVTATTSTSISPTRVTPNGLVTGPGVDDTGITLGLLVDPGTDRGFSAGVELWQQSVNAAGGLCGRSIQTDATGSAGESLAAGYPRTAVGSLGLIALPAAADAGALDALVMADEMPTLTLTGSSAALSGTGMVPIGATEDIKSINALAYLRSTGKLLPGSALGVVTDSSAAARDASAGAKWWAQANGVTVVETATGIVSPDVRAVLVVAAPAEVQRVLSSVPATTDVVTNLAGYDPAQVSGPAGRLLITMAAPAFGSDNPGAAAVARAFVAAGKTDPGPNLMSGYGVAAAWGRLIVQACAQRTLTRAGISAAMEAVGPAPADSLFGPSDPGLVVGSALPATRVSSVASADPKAPAGLRPLIWLQAAPGIARYLPTR